MFSYYEALLLFATLISQFDRIDFTCIPYTHQFEKVGKDLKPDTSLCLVFLRPIHVKAYRINKLQIEPRNFADDKAAVVENQTMAEDACKSLPSLTADVTDVPDTTDPPVRKEMHNFTRIYSTPSNIPDPQPRLIYDVDPKKDLEWLMEKAYQVYGSRTGGGVFLHGSKDLGASRFKGYEPKDITIVMKNYNDGQCPLLLFDPGLPHRQGVVWVDCTNPYKNRGVASKQIVCQYKNPQDCILQEMEPNCKVDEETQHCIWKDYFEENKTHPKHPLGTKCRDDMRKRIVDPCPFHRRHQCDRNCEWGEWRVVQKCKHCVYDEKDENLQYETLIREIKFDSFANGQQCEDSEGSKTQACLCASSANRLFRLAEIFLGMPFLIMLVSMK